MLEIEPAPLFSRLQIHYVDETNRSSEATACNNSNIVAAGYRQFDRGLTQDVYGSYTFNQAVTGYLGINHVTGEIPAIGETFYPVSTIFFVGPGKNDSCAVDTLYSRVSSRANSAPMVRRQCRALTCCT